jgi:D-threo-aldose 1-dehydrogenase
MPQEKVDAACGAALPRRPIGRTGLEVTTLGFGGLQVGDYWAKMSEADATACIRHAHDVGIRYFDTAPQYGSGLSEHRIGAVLRTVPRASFVLSTKVGRYLVPLDDAATDDPARRGLPFEKVYDLGYDATMRGFEQSLHRLGLNRVDLAFIHDLDPYQLGDAYDATFEVGIEGCYRALDELRRAGVVKGIGAGLNDAPAACRLIGATNLDCLMIAGRYTLIEQAPAATLLPLAERRGVTLIVGAPYNTGILATGAIAGARYNNHTAPPDILERVRAIEGVGQDFGVGIAAAALQFPLLDLNVAAVVPGMSSVLDVDRNLELIRTPIPKAFWHRLGERGLLDDAAIQIVNRGV